MNISTQNTNYQTLVQHQKPTKLYNKQEISKASNGNATVGKDGEITLTPQGMVNLEHTFEKDVKAIEKEVRKEEQAFLHFAADVIKEQSQKMQVEMFLAVANEGMHNGISNNTINLIELLREVQLENNIVQAYSIYEEELKALT